MSKRILSLVLTLALVLGTLSTAFAATPSDVVGTDVEDAVTRLGALGILTGYEDGSFQPEGNITRAEFSAVVSRARGLEQAAINSKGNTAFGDVPASHWASGYVNVASEAGLVKGMGEVNGVNTFGPALNITYEQAVTLVVRALGYEPAAQANGGYPQGHLIVASQQGLLDGVKGVQGQKATRGLVAQLTDNALEVPKMIQVGYGDQAKFVVSGTEYTEEKFLFDDLQIDRLVEATITSADSSKNKITVEGKVNKNDTKVVGKTLKVADNFDFAGLEGLKVTVWYNNSNGTLVDVKVSGDYTAKFDAIEVTKTEKEIKLVTENKKYDVDSKATVYIEGDKKDIEDLVKSDDYDYAKVILNEYSDVIRIDAYDLDEMIVVEEVKNGDIFGYNGEELVDADEYTIIKNGKQISEESLEDKDIVLYNTDEEYAAVLTETKTGEIERVYSEAFKFEGKTYDNSNDRRGEVKYISDEDLVNISREALDEMKDNGEVTLVFDFEGNLVLVDGDAGEVVSNYVMVTTDSEGYDGRAGKTTYNVDVLNAEGTVVKYDVDEDDIDDIINVDKNNDNVINELDLKAIVEEKAVIKLTVDADNEITEIEEAKEVAIKNVKFDSNYIAGYKANSSAVVFWTDGETKVKDYTTLTWGDVEEEFEEVVTGSIYVEDNKIVAVYAAKTNADTKTQPVVGVVTNVSKINSDKYDVTIEVNGEEKIYEGTSSSFSRLYNDVKDADQVVILNVSEQKETATSFDYPTGSELETVTVNNATTRKINDYDVRGKYYERKSNGALEEISYKDVAKTATVYFQPGAKAIVQVVVSGGTPNQVNTSGVVTYVNATDGSFAIDGKLITLTKEMVLVEDGKIILSGSDIVNGTGKLIEDDQVKVEGKTITIVARKAERDAAAELKAAQDAVTKAEGSKLQADIDAAQTLVTALPGDVAPATTKADLQARLNAVQSIVSEVTSGNITTQEGLDLLIAKGVVEVDTTIDLDAIAGAGVTGANITVNDLIVVVGKTLTVTEGNQNVELVNVIGAVTIN